MFDGINAAMKFAGMLEKIVNDAGLKEKFSRDGKISGRLQVEDYDIVFEVRRREHA